MKVAITGASGFIGSYLVPYLIRQRGHTIVEVPRIALSAPDAFIRGCEVVIHLAGIAHQRNINFADMDTANRQLPVALAHSAAQAGVRRFVFVSSVAAAVAPETPYGRAKAAAEAELLALNTIDVTVLRPPLVYGRGVPGNMGSLLRLSRLPIPLPFASADRKRSLVYVGNLADALAFTAEHLELNGKVFTVTDGEDVSLAQIVTSFRRGMGRPAWLFRAPWLEPCLRGIGAGRVAQKLLGELRFDSSLLASAGWTAPFEVIASLSESAQPG